MTDIKFGTDGWRAIIAKEFTTDNVARVSLAVANFLNEKNENPSVVIGHDCRFAGELFAETAAKVLATKGVKVLLAKDFVSTPMVSLGVINYKSNIGVVITASHNPPSYNGYKLKGDFGGPLLSHDITDVENRIPDYNSIDINSIKIDDLIESGMIKYIDLEDDYCKHAENNFDLDAIKNSGLKLAYDPMFGAGINVISRLLPDVLQIHNDINPGFHGQAPEPIHRNLLEFSELIKSRGDIDCGLATDGDADRIGLYNGKGEFIDSHHLILLLIHYMVKYKGIKGKVVTAFSCTVKVEKICKHYGLDQETVQIGFKHIAGKMISEDVLLGGEESGGIATKGHIPERDGIWMGLILFEFMAKTGKSLEDLIVEVYAIVGPFAFERIDLHIDNDIKNTIVQNCKDGKYTYFGKYSVERIETTDGFKFFFDDDTWLMIRPSGTEPVLRTYAEASSQEKCFDILEDTRKTLLG
ncbi:MAG: phosphoglucomutase/phosphomannomutase family protein [Flavobacteriales bacterium]|jgi:phosphomannomutase|nr:phosphoglucomutase/phosphomannomutase family protein [Flavobacteriales bacterium]MBT6013979.1 phosphoglucomutase/phosphomannomutase family protein [Flavobacteriales bacterium]MBT7481297.1 phosphoglucomutase/phosphomannomutase family protein [Flavobacteriales bacterium]